MKPRLSLWVAASAVIAEVCGLSRSMAVAAQPFAQNDGPEISGWRVFGALLFCLLLALGAVLAIRFKTQGTLAWPQAWSWKAWLENPKSLLNIDRGRRLKLLETLRLSHQIDICLIKLDDREIVVAATPQGGFVIFTSDSTQTASPSQ